MDNIPLGVRTVHHHQHDILNRQIAVTSCLPAPDLAPTEYAIIPTGQPHTTLTFQSINPQTGINGLSMESLLAVCVDRLQHFQAGQFKSSENALALTHLEEAMHWLQHRTRDREARGVLGQRVP